MNRYHCKTKCLQSLPIEAQTEHIYPGAAPGRRGAAGVRAAERQPRHVALRLPLQLQLRQRGEDSAQPGTSRIVMWCAGAGV